MLPDPPVQLPDPVAVAVPVFIVLVLAEVLAWWRGARLSYETRDTATSLSLGGLNLVSGFLQGAAIALLHPLIWQVRLFDLGWAWWVWVLAFFAEDLSYYAFHRVAHERRWVWAGHVTHHSSQHYNLSTALRQPVFSAISLSFVFWLPLTWLGFHPAMIAFFKGTSLVYQFWIHTEVIRTLGPLERVFNTPSHHRVHHATNPRYLDANYAGVLIVWDRLFGTFVPEDPADPPRYGLVTQIGTFHPLKAAFHEWVAIARDLRTARSWREVLGYTWGPPGWRPDGAGHTTAWVKRRAER
ncbi:MAG: sterol desaturase family protein [Alphaproteobacteria bacterium]|nr:sterol desaturase family protein [Alphaproteobacteria bacterium]